MDVFVEYYSCLVAKNTREKFTISRYISTNPFFFKNGNTTQQSVTL